jgi:4-hydroxybenzoate polyprenyltransferase
MDLPLRRSRLALWLDLIRWDRPAGWLLLLWPTLSALWIAAGGFPAGTCWSCSSPERS